MHTPPHIIPSPPFLSKLCQLVPAGGLHPWPAGLRGAAVPNLAPPRLLAPTSSAADTTTPSSLVPMWLHWATRR
jgi:hypothetical protein